jgi:hypothetical protein
VLKGNNDNVSGMRWLTGTYATIRDTTQDQNKIMNNGLAFGMKVGYPYGYNGLNGFLLPQQPGGFIRATLSGESSFGAVISSLGNMYATLTGEGVMTLGANIAFNMYCTMIGEGNLTPDLKAKAWMWATLDAGARPSAYDIAQEIWQAQATQYNSTGTMGEKLNGAGTAGNPWTEVIESGLTAGQVMKIIASVLAGKTVITDLGGGNATVVFRDINDTKDVVTADMEGSKRTDVTLNT